MNNKVTVNAIENFITVWGDSYLANDLGEKLTCVEADAIVELFKAFGESKAASYWADAHAFSDDEGDSHYEEGN